MKYQAIQENIQNAKHIAVLQADNPDGDSLGSALALEAIFSELGKQVSLLCAVDMPQHLRYLNGWDRVQKDIPKDLDLTIVVDASTESLFEYYETNGALSWLKAKPLIVIDHHTETDGLSYASVSFIEEAVATSELIFRIAQELKWPLPADACEMMAVSIMSDSLGLTTEASTPESYRVMAELIERGASIPKLEQARRELMRKEPELLAYKGRLLQRVTFDTTGRIASVTIPWEEIETYSPSYNPSMLALDDMRLVVGVDIAIAYKVYRDGKITAKIRANFERGIAGKLGAHFGGGGHPYAAGFKIMKARPIDELVQEVNKKANELLDELHAEA
ncbi:MAG TPA: DHH family phosphoesterase [Candidatus Saccharibacteria bacterium]|jgi:phosphoesterase RecJ-like protein|nr:DHH family phosphoesterase [Candidatus Saccharibacteria bacterium]HMT55361.1 DHH family phosphoesterase [Candidatus Saccharibacteria bacterium]